MMQWLKRMSYTLLVCGISVAFVAAQDACPASVDDALVTMNDLCLSIGRNQACYGNGDIVAIPQMNANIDFTAPGDTATADDIQSLSLAPFAGSLDDWGVAVFVVQASLPDTIPGQNVTMVIFGDAYYSNDNGAYYFTSGIGAPECNQAPNGMLIQTPEGVGTVTLTMNGVNIELGSTLYIGTPEENVMTIALLEGNVDLTTPMIDDPKDLAPEEYVTIALDDEGNAHGEFLAFGSVSELDLGNLPLTLLPRDITETEDDSTNTSDSAISGDAIQPRQGTWTGTAGDATMEGCPSFMSIDMLDSFGVDATNMGELTYDGTFSAQSIIDFSGVEQMGMTYTSDNPSPNRYMINLSLAEEGVSLVIDYTWDVLSEESIAVSLVETVEIPDYGTCVITLPFTIEYAGE